MPERRALLWILMAAALTFALVHVLPGVVMRRFDARGPQPIDAAPVGASPDVRGDEREPPREGPPRWIVGGGGPTPEMNQVQIEQDLLLATRVLAAHGSGRVLFAGGPRGRAVQELDPDAPLPADALVARLGELFDPRPGRDGHYRPTRLRPDGPASRESILAAIEGALTDGDRPLLVYLAGHGFGGEAPHESSFETWGGGPIAVEDVAALLDGMGDHRPVRFVMTSCYSGGFAELAFAAANPEEGPATTARCGLFATTWDRVAAGCDPNPDRGAQEGYGIHFLHALAGEDRRGRPLEGLDLDGDGAISLLEAHTRARIASSSFDLPVTTSETYLRSVVEAPADAPTPEEPRVGLPEERAVVDGLEVRLGIADASEARARMAALETELEASGGDLDRLEAELDAAHSELAAALLHRWPELGDPWRADFASQLEANREAIEAFLAESAVAARTAEVEAEHAQLADVHDALLVSLAPIERLLRSHETLTLAAALRREGGTPWLRYQAFLACERGLP